MFPRCSRPSLPTPPHNPFRITLFADPHPLNPIESHSCKKQGRGTPSASQSLPSFSTSAHKSNTTVHITSLPSRAFSNASGQFPSPRGGVLSALTTRHFFNIQGIEGTSRKDFTTHYLLLTYPPLTEFSRSCALCRPSYIPPPSAALSTRLAPTAPRLEGNTTPGIVPLCADTAATPGTPDARQ
jgi:hypothetical protein